MNSDIEMYDSDMELDVDMKNDNDVDMTVEDIEYMNIINNLINKFKNVSFFSDEDEYMKLNDASKMELEDLEYESDIIDVLENTYQRYLTYLKNIEFTDSLIDIKNKIKIYLIDFKDYKKDDKYLFALMNEIDNDILDNIHDSKEVRFWK